MKASYLYELAEQIGLALRANQHILVVAESCTGGWIAKTLTDVPGSSEWFERGYVTYSNQSKHEMLAVSSMILSSVGAVSELAVKAMAEGALRISHANVALAVSGVAGPGGGTEEKPVGTAWFAWVIEGQTYAEHRLFHGDREAIRQQCVQFSLEKLLSLLQRDIA
jgi:nicotinamide-nucleotide amidase